MKKTVLKPLIICIAVPLLAGGFSALLSGDISKTYRLLEHPPLSPPPIVFPVVWSILYILMGISSYLIYKNSKNKEDFKSTMIAYALQLILNILWTPIFFRAELYWVGAFWIIALIIAVLSMIKAFEPISRIAACLQTPYLVWCCFAAYLSFGIAALN